MSFGDENLTEAEIRERLKKMGIPVDGWQDNPDPEGEVEITSIPTYERIADGLKGLHGMIEERIGQDQKQIQELNLKMARLKHGGGR